MLGPLSNVVAWGKCHEWIPFWKHFGWLGACDWSGTSYFLLRNVQRNEGSALDDIALALPVSAAP